MIQNVKSLRVIRHVFQMSVLFQGRVDCSPDIKLCAQTNCLQPSGESLPDIQINLENMFNIFRKGSEAHCTKQGPDTRVNN